MNNTPPPPGAPGTTGTHHIDGSVCDYPTQGSCAHQSHVNPGAGLPPDMQALLQQLGTQIAPGQITIGDPVKPKRRATCKTCNQRIEQDEHGTWTDETGGDVCEDDILHEPKPRPQPKFVTNTQHVNISSDAERIRLQLKAGLDDNGRPLKDADRQALERQLEFHNQEITEDDEARALLGVEDDADAEIKRLLGYQENP